jgi:hypothetical protein
MPAKPFVFGTFFAPQTPASLSNLVFWCKYNTGHYQDSSLTTPATGTDPVGGWQDQSGNGNHLVQATGVWRPLLDSGAVHFDGTEDYLATSASFTLKPFTFFGLVNLDAIGTYFILGAGGQDGMNLQVTDAAPDTLTLVKQFTAVIATSSYVPTASAWVRFIATYDGSGNYAFYVNGATEGTGTNDTAIDSEQIVLGAIIQGGSPQFFLDGQVKDCGVYSDVKSGADITLIDDYLATL